MLPMTYVSATATNASGSTSEFGPVCADPLNPGKVDSDGDGLCDDWELHGIDYNGDGITDLPLNTMGADPRRKDLFVEADWMDTFKPENGALQAVVDAFDVAPVPSGVPGETVASLCIW